MRLLVMFALLFIIACSNNKDADRPARTKDGDLNLIARLDTIWRTEQEPIRLRDSLGKVYGYESEEFNKQNEIYHKNHEINEKKIIAILTEYGWPGKEVIGENGNLTICNVLQHSGNDTRLKYIPMMREAVKMGKLEPRFLARAEDRLATDRGDLQIYGGQIKYYPETKTFDVWPIIDPENVDKRREEIGLEPIAEFLKNRRESLEWNLDEQIKRTEEFKKKKELNEK